jgi:DNA (cytosine-5)-methyltransferase 1
VTLVALDDFAGTGWSVACQRLGILDHGVELMDEAVATRAAAGMSTIGRDVWAHLEHCLAHPIEYPLYIASPPCQTFSSAGKGSGRAALDLILRLVDERAYLRVDELHAFGEAHDPRTALVMVPLVRVARDQPTYVVLEQVPPVLPVWERFAQELESWGYSTWTGILNAEQYGVPQTRRRAVLIARADGVQAAPPVPTHSRYYSRDPQRLDEGVLPWVSMADALGWQHEHDGREAHAMRGSGQTARYGERPGRRAGEPAFTLRANGGGNASGGFVWRDLNLDPARPATIVAGDPRLTSREHHAHGEQSSTSTRITLKEAATLQSYPAEFPFQGTKTKQFLQVGNAVPPLLAEAILSVFLPGGAR